MSLETFQRVLPILDHADGLGLDNHGEPLLNPDLETIIIQAKRRNPRLSVGLTSNFTLMTRERAFALLAAGLDHVQVSINGTTRSTYEKIMCGARFEALNDHLGHFASARRTVRNRLRTFSVCYTTMRSNLDELVGLPAMVAPFGVNLIRVNCLLPFNAAAQQEAIMDDPVWDARRSAVYGEFQNQAQRFGIQFYLPSISADPGTCPYPAHNLAVNVQGDVSPCWMLDIPPRYHFYRRSREYPLPFVSFGNVHEQGITDIWNSERFKHFRGKFLGGTPPRFCADCPVGMKQVCG